MEEKEEGYFDAVREMHFGSDVCSIFVQFVAVV